jgi:hypothetical protein
MIDWIKALKEIDCKFDNEGQGGTGIYVDEKFGEVDFQWHANKSKIEIIWFDSEPFCICGNQIGHIDCDCEWDWFQESEPKRKVFKKAQVIKLLQPTLF